MFRIVFTELLDLLIMANTVAKSAGRALGLSISNYKAFGGMTLKVRSVPEKLFSLIIEIGRQKYVQSCIFTR